MQITWQSVKAEDGKTLEGIYSGTVEGEPWLSVLVDHANWRVLVNGAEAANGSVVGVEHARRSKAARVAVEGWVSSVGKHRAFDAMFLTRAVEEA